MVVFLLISFGLAWACQLPVYAGGGDGLASLALLAIGGIAPTVAAVIVTRGAVWRETWRGPRPAWALGLGLVGPSLLVALAGLATGSLTVTAPSLGSALLPPLGEELGWRGYLQARWRPRLGALGTSVAVGIIWALWHLPTAWGHWDGFPRFAATVTAGGVVMGWLWERSRRSILAAVALHTGLNLGIVHAARGAVTVAWIACAVAAALALARRPAGQRAGNRDRS
jgi:membrane protease YdiL (CAAX protease family)